MVEVMTRPILALALLTSCTPTPLQQMSAPPQPPTEWSYDTPPPVAERDVFVIPEYRRCYVENERVAAAARAEGERERPAPAADRELFEARLNYWVHQGLGLDLALRRALEDVQHWGQVPDGRLNLVFMQHCE